MLKFTNYKSIVQFLNAISLIISINQEYLLSATIKNSLFDLSFSIEISHSFEIAWVAENY